MKIAIIGSSRGVGRYCVLEGLLRGHEVISLSRSIAPACKHQNLHHVVGDATRASVIKNLLTHADAVIVTIGNAVNKRHCNLYTNMAFALCEAYEEVRKRIPVVVVSAFGVGTSSIYLKWHEKLILQATRKEFISNKASMEKVISTSPLNWIIVRPKLVASIRKEKADYRVVTEYDPDYKISSITRLTLAKYLIHQAENPKHLFKFPIPQSKRVGYSE